MFLAACVLYCMFVIEFLCLWQIRRPVSVVVGNNSNIETRISFSTEVSAVEVYVSLLQYLCIWMLLGVEVFFKPT